MAGVACYATFIFFIKTCPEFFCSSLMSHLTTKLLGIACRIFRKYANTSSNLKHTKDTTSKKGFSTICSNVANWNQPLMQ